jgi:hypothetical protein
VTRQWATLPTGTDVLLDTSQDNQLSSGSEIKNAWSYTATPLYIMMAQELLRLISEVNVKTSKVLPLLN